MTEEVEGNAPPGGDGARGFETATEWKAAVITPGIERTDAII